VCSDAHLSFYSFVASLSYKNTALALATLRESTPSCIGDRRFNITNRKNPQRNSISFTSEDNTTVTGEIHALNVVLFRMRMRGNNFEFVRMSKDCESFDKILAVHKMGNLKHLFPWNSSQPAVNKDCLMFLRQEWFALRRRRKLRTSTPRFSEFANPSQQQTNAAVMTV